MDKPLLSTQINSNIIHKVNSHLSQIKIKIPLNFFFIERTLSSVKILYSPVIKNNVGIRAQNHILGLGPWLRTLIGLKTIKQ